MYACLNIGIFPYPSAYVYGAGGSGSGLSFSGETLSHRAMQSRSKSKNPSTCGAVSFENSTLKRTDISNTNIDRLSYKAVLAVWSPGVVASPVVEHVDDGLAGGMLSVEFDVYPIPCRLK